MRPCWSPKISILSYFAMIASKNQLLLLLFCVFLFASSSSRNSMVSAATHDLLIRCGTNEPQTDSGRSWVADDDPKFSTSLLNTAVDTPQNPALVPQVPYASARFFTSNFTYTLPITPGRNFLRLYFNLDNYTNHVDSLARFSVTTGKYTLLNNFSTSLTASARHYDILPREFSINITSSVLDLTFAPSTSLPNSYAFINGIEITPSPDIFVSSDASAPFLVGSSDVKYDVDPGSAFETVYRLNVGGSDISPVDDSELFRQWYDDSPYLYGAASGATFSKDPNVSIKYPPRIPRYIAPVGVYETARSMGANASVNLRYNLTWILTVDPGFSYLVRLHFCEIQNVAARTNSRVFDIFINNQTALVAADVIALSGGFGVPVYQDFVVLIHPGSTQVGLWIALHPDVSTIPYFDDAILNGMEIFKLSTTSNNLAGPNPSLATIDQNTVLPLSRPIQKSRTPAIVGGVVGGIAFVLLCLLLFVIIRSQQSKKGSTYSDNLYGTSRILLSIPESSHSATSGKTNATGSSAYTLPANLCRHFSFSEIEAATNGFEESLILGVGGFGNVYRGAIDSGSTKVAIKRANPSSEQGIHEFVTEIELLSRLRHLHLVSLIGYCQDNGEMILVYDYMAHGTLREHLYKSNKPPLTWKQRLEICIGAARGLHYLHTGAKHTIIHRDVKTTNILLDEKFVAKVSDFGLSKTGPAVDNTHVSTVVKGSFGYLDPEYFRRQQLTDKSDVYSFGVVLFEVLCARPALNRQLPKEQMSLAEWALHCQRNGVLDELIDPYLKDKIAPKCLKKYVETAEKCLAEKGTDRPAMGDVLWSLEFALQLQESAEETGVFVAGSSDSEIKSSFLGGEQHPERPSTEATTGTNTTTAMSASIGGRSISSEDSNVMTPSAVFSQIVNPSGR